MMKHLPMRYVSLLLGLLLVCLTPTLAFAANPGIQYTIVLNGTTYEVYMRPDFTPAPGALTLTAQVTIKVPHSAATPFTANSLTNPITGVTWSMTSRINAPTEAPGFDYLSFEANMTSNSALLAGRTANQPFKIFSFQNSAACIGVVTVMDNNDVFNNQPNSAGTNPGNTVFSLTNGELYDSNYSTIAADCSKSDLSVTIGQPSPAFQPGVTSNVPVTVTNSGAAPSGPATVTVPLPTGVTAPASFNSGPWVCTSTSTTVTCTDANPIAPGTSSPISIPMTPGVSAIGTTPTLNAGVATNNDSNPANNNASPVTTAPITGGPDLTVTVGTPSPALKDGITSQIPVTVTNVGNAPTTGPITEVLTVPAGLTVPATFTSNGWSCTTSGQTVTCTNPGPINPTVKSPFNIPVTPVGASSTPLPPITCSTTATGDTNSSNNTCTPSSPGPVAGSPDLAVVVGSPAPTLHDGITSQIPVTVTNVGSGPTTGPITEAVTVPAGLTVPATFTSNGWSCTTSGQTVTCTNPGPINPTVKSPFSIPVTPTAVSPTPLSPATCATTTTGDIGSANNTCTPVSPGPVAGSPDLVTTVGQPSPALKDGVTSQVPVTVTNQGTGPTTGPITTTIPLPTGITAPASFTNNGWTCTSTSTTVTCVTPGPINNGTSKPLSVPLTSTPAAVGTTPAIVATPTTPGDKTPTNNPSPSTPLGPVAGTPDVTVSLGQPAPDLKDGVPSNLPVAVGNSGSGPTTGPTVVTVPLPPGVTAPATFNPGNGWSCTTTGSTVTCTNPNTIPAGTTSPFNVPITPDATTVGTTPTFNASVSTPNESNTTNNTATPLTTPTVTSSSVSLPIKVILAGDYNQTAGLMRDDLRTLNLIPTASPYSGAQATANASVFAVTGNNAIVDWVLVELHNATTPATVVTSQAALLQRDGDVVGVDGVSPLVVSSTFANQSYYVAVKHRNHLGVMTLSPILLTSTTALVDFTASSTGVYGTNAEKIIGSVRALWSGNTNGNKNVISAGPTNDVNPILGKVLSDPGNTNLSANYIVAGYLPTDVNMDGKTIGAGPNNDVNPILTNVFTHPSNTTLANNYIIVEQLP